MADAPRLTAAREAERAARDKRLAGALRANLQRRKEQARARQDRDDGSVREPEPKK
jgi:hypothetical protein